MSLELQTQQQQQQSTTSWDLESPRATRLVSDSFRYAFALCQDPSQADLLVRSACTRLQQKGEPFAKRSLYTAVREIYFESEAEAELSASAPRSASGSLDDLTSTERELVFLLSVEGWTLDDFSAHTGRFGRSADGFLMRVREKMGLSVSDDPAVRATIRENPLPEQVLEHIQQTFAAIDLPSTTLDKLGGLLDEIEKVPEGPRTDIAFPSIFDGVKKHSRKYGPKVLLGFVAALGIRACVASSSPVSDWVRQAAEDVATSHQPGSAHEFPMTTAAALNAAMSRLDFALAIDDDVVDDDDQLLGASYSSVLGRPAVRLHIRREGGDEESVYVCKAGEILHGMSSKSYSFDPYDLDVWEEDGLLFFELELDD